MMEMELKTALDIVLNDLENNNNHTLGRLLFWAYFENELTPEKAEESYRAWLLARNFFTQGGTASE